MEAVAKQAYITKESSQQKDCEHCPVQTTLQVVGGKWKPVILWRMEQGTLRFGELKRSIPGITQKMLTQQLRELEVDGVVWRKVYPEVPPRVEYGITPYGSSLRFLLNAMAEWGFRHQNFLANQDRNSIKKIKKRKATLA
jgi:DNA-binding HxlR family transcriptional regulator